MSMRTMRTVAVLPQQSPAPRIGVLPQGFSGGGYAC